MTDDVRESLKRDLAEDDISTLETIGDLVNYQEKSKGTVFELREISSFVISAKIKEVIDEKGWKARAVASSFSHLPYMTFDKYTLWWKSLKGNFGLFEENKIEPICIVSNISSQPVPDAILTTLSSSHSPHPNAELSLVNGIKYSGASVPVPVQLLAGMGLKSRYRLLQSLEALILKNNVPSPALLETFSRLLYICSEYNLRSRLFKEVGTADEPKLNVLLDLINNRLFRLITWALFSSPFRAQFY